MAVNIVVTGGYPRWNVDNPSAAHNSGDLAVENGRIGVVVDTCVTTGAAGASPFNSIANNNRTTLLTKGIFLLPVPAGTAAGAKLYTTTASIAAGFTVQAAPSRTTAVASTLTTASTSGTLVGVAREAASAYGATTAANVELADYPIT